MSQDTQPDAAAIAEEILVYLRAHPQAADTFDGVVQWWLIRSRYLRGLSQVRLALDLLVARGDVVERIGADQARCYFASKSSGTSG